MIKTTVEVDGMMCSMCETHVNDAVRKNLDVKKVNSSRKKKQTVIISENELSEEMIRNAIDPTGYKTGEIKSEPYRKKGLFGL